MDVTILIPTYDRPQALADTLARVVAVTRGGVPVVVVDDASPTHEAAEICARYTPAVRYIRLPEKRDAIHARNTGLATITTRYVLHLDDDSDFSEPDLIGRLRAFFFTHPSAVALALNIVKPGQQPMWPVDAEPFQVRTYTNCATAWRLPLAGTLHPGIGPYGEELEHSMRIVDAGGEIWAVPGLVVHHRLDPQHRDRRRSMSFAVASYLRRILLRVPGLLLPWALLRWTAFTLRHIRSVSLRAVLADMQRPDRSLSQAWRQRRPVRIRTYFGLERLKRDEKRFHHA
jgi:glycosyltransferase involved in cell wall biosynthesis